MKKSTIIFIIAAVVCLSIALLSLKDNIFSPYVPLSKAIEEPGSHVQVIGTIDKRSVSYQENGYSFTIIDKSNTKVAVFKSGMKPFNFEHADQVVLIGSYDAFKKIFNAERVLTKCPSRYVRKR